MFWRRYTLVRQNDRSDCGAAALATLALHYRQPIRLERLRDLSRTDRNGANLLGLLRAAEVLGFSAKAVRTADKTLSGLPLPAIAHVCDSEGLGHFVVIHRVSGNAVVVADPARGIIRTNLDSFCREWSGHLLLAVPHAELRATASEIVPSPWRRFLTLLRPHAGILLEVIVCALATTLLAVSTSYFVQHLVDSVLVRQERKLLNALGLGMLCVVLFRALFSLLRQYLLAHVGRKIDLILIGAYTRHVLRLPMRFFETRKLGEIVSRVTDAGRLRDAINGVVTSAIVDGTVVAGMLVILWFYDLPLAVATAAIVPAFLLTVALHHSAGRRRAGEALENGAQLAAHMIEDVAGVETVKSCVAEHQRTEHGETRLLAFVQSLFSMQMLELRVQGLATLLTGVASVGVLWFGGHRVMDGALTIGQLLFFYTLLATLLEPLNRLATVNIKLQDALAAIDRLFQILDVEAESTADDKMPFERLRDAIEFDGVSFAYGNRGQTLDQLRLRIPAGKTVALVGESGSGKSTLLKLLLQQYQPDCGRILIDGADARDYHLPSLRSGIGVVSQDPYIFNGTIRDNIALGRPDTPLSEIIAAVRAAGLEEFVAALPQRYDTVIGERGANLSGGQRQRLAIARALVRRPEIIVFDEATSHLDAATEHAIQESLRTALAGHTVVLVAHRLSTVQDADLIYVLQHGRIVEQGTDRQLLAQGGVYCDLWRAQLGRRDRLEGAVPALSGASARCSQMPLAQAS